MSDDKPFSDAKTLRERLGAVAHGGNPLGEAPLYEGEDRAASPLCVYAL
ncbi:MAG: hypothetical protein ICV85_03490 [Tolypothrix sp. T3-bin4]|nr:hypothetical protein [Tolypothrix sp. Co-bin9]MBD0301259.1 hypothetical protein [Tolypothrix sp. T3-bin4]